MTRVHWGHTPFRVKSDPEFGQLSADLTNHRLTETEFGPNGPFSGSR